MDNLRSKWIFSDLKFDETSIYDGPVVSTSLLFEIIAIFVNFRTKKEETKNFGRTIVPKLDMPACHRRAYLFRHGLKLFCSEQEVWRAMGQHARDSSMPKIAVFGYFWTSQLCKLINPVILVPGKYRLVKNMFKALTHCVPKDIPISLKMTKILTCE